MQALFVSHVMATKAALIDYKVLVSYLEAIGTSQSRYWLCTVECGHLEHDVLLWLGC